MKPTELLKEENLKYIFMSKDDTFGGCPYNLKWFYEKYFKTDCLIAFCKNIKLEDIAKRMRMRPGKEPGNIDIFIIKGKNINKIYAFWIPEDVKGLANTKYQKGFLGRMLLTIAVKELEENKNSKILNEEGYLKAKKLVILEALQ